MNKYLSQLVKLSEINREIDAFEPKILKIDKMVSVAFEKAKIANSKIGHLDNDIKEIKSKKAKNNSLLSELSGKLKLLDKKASSVRNEKELRSLQLEEDIIKEQCDFANDEIERLEKIMELKETEKQKTKELHIELKKSAEELNASMDIERKAIKREVAAAYAKKDELVGTMSQKILSFYEKIRKWAHSSAVVPVKKQACYGCFMRINDKTNALVFQSEDIITCPHCGRILYMETTEA